MLAPLFASLSSQTPPPPPPLLQATWPLTLTTSQQPLTSSSPLAPFTTSQVTCLEIQNNVVDDVSGRPKRVISAHDDGAIKCWELKRSSARKGLRVEGGGEAFTLCGHTARVTAMAVGSDDKLLTGSRDCTVRLWDLSTMEAAGGGGLGKKKGAGSGKEQLPLRSYDASTVL